MAVGVSLVLVLLSLVIRPPRAGDALHSISFPLSAEAKAQHEQWQAEAQHSKAAYPKVLPHPPCD